MSVPARATRPNHNQPSVDPVFVRAGVPDGSALMDDLRVKVIELRGNGGLGVFLRVGDEARLYRVAPVRDPNQPRFWCLAAFECSSCGIPVSGSAIWAGWWGSSQPELARIFDAIKEDAGTWLANEQCAKLRTMLLRPRAPRQMPVARTAGREACDHADEALADTAERAS